MLNVAKAATYVFLQSFIIKKIVKNVFNFPQPKVVSSNILFTQWTAKKCINYVFKFCKLKISYTIFALNFYFQTNCQNSFLNLIRLNYCIANKQSRMVASCVACKHVRILTVCSCRRWIRKIIIFE